MLSIPDQCGDICDRACGKDVLNFRALACLGFDHASKTHGKKTMTTKGKEIRRWRDCLAGEQCFKMARDQVFGCSTLRFFDSTNMIGLGNGRLQIFTVDLAICVHGKMRENHETFGDHIVGEIAGKGGCPRVPVIMIRGNRGTEKRVCTGTNR